VPELGVTIVSARVERTCRCAKRSVLPVCDRALCSLVACCPRSEEATARKPPLLPLVRAGCSPATRICHAQQHTSQSKPMPSRRSPAASTAR